MDFKNTLQYLCIRVIADEFIRFYDLFDTDDAELERKFQLLLRLYSYEIVEELEDIGDLQEAYLEVLINQYTRIVRSNWFEDMPWETVTEMFAEVGSTILEIDFYDHKEPRPWKNIIHYLINVELVIFPIYFNDEILKCISEFCPNIVEIIASDSGVSNEGIKYLCMKENEKPVCPKLRKLYIANSGVNYEGVDHLIRNLKTLEETDYRGLPTVIVYSQLENYMSGFNKVEPYNLTFLDLLSIYPELENGNVFNMCNEICLTLCPRLKLLHCLIKNEEHLDLFPYELKELRLVCFSDPKINITNFLKLKGRTLIKLSLSDCILSVGTLAESCPCLVKLELHKVRFKFDNITPVFHRLQNCTFGDTINEYSTSKLITLLLTSSPKLWRITFQTCNLSSSVLRSEILRSCKYNSIKEVQFSRSSVGMDFAKEFLEDCHSLQAIELKNCDVNIKDAIEFHKFAERFPNNRIVLDDIDEEDKIDFRAELWWNIPVFVFSKST